MKIWMSLCNACYACYAAVARPVPGIPRLPRKTTVNVRFWHACHIKGQSSKHRRMANAFVKGPNFRPLQWALFKVQLSTFTEERVRGETYQGLLTRCRFPVRPRTESFSFAFRKLCLFGFSLCFWSICPDWPGKWPGQLSFSLIIFT